MDVKIKTFDVDMNVKNNGVEFEVRRPNGGEHLGDLILQKGHLVWCKGRTHRENGVRITWQRFIDWAENL
ncbi:hypothetical protein V6C03_07070 [Methyloligella sp. 2.7D]|uniref:hypothetical protein n=1 Tax=unclassified Methyloligella TaxID=2625955 RepID=UPI00157BE28D|nr:hypothetical protein [Methyloligella sp. GL2]QKP78345.1 hypothetical protein HT051_13375 [Methyloligella sp. GL2]